MSNLALYLTENPHKVELFSVWSKVINSVEFDIIEIFASYFSGIPRQFLPISWIWMGTRGRRIDYNAPHSPYPYIIMSLFLHI